MIYCIFTCKILELICMRDLTVLWPEGGLYISMFGGSADCEGMWEGAHIWRSFSGIWEKGEVLDRAGHGAIGAWYTYTKYTVNSTKLLFPLFPYGNLVPQSICDWLKSVAFTTGKYCSKVCLEPKITPNYLEGLAIIHMTFRSGFVKWKIKISVKRTDQSWMETQYVCHTWA